MSRAILLNTICLTGNCSCRCLTLASVITKFALWCASKMKSRTRTQQKAPKAFICFMAGKQNTAISEARRNVKSQIEFGSVWKSAQLLVSLTLFWKRNELTRRIMNLLCLLTESHFQNSGPWMNFFQLYVYWYCLEYLWKINHNRNDTFCTSVSLSIQYAASNTVFFPYIQSEKVL